MKTEKETNKGEIIMMKNLQKLGKALMLPVAVLPIASILMGIGYALCPSAMQGGDIIGTSAQIGFFLIKAGSAIVDNMPLLFAVGVGVGLADDHDGSAAIAALVSWLLITTLLSRSNVETMLPGFIRSEIQGIAFDKIQNAFIGILCGITGALCYNRFKGQRLPDFLAFFSGRRFVAIATAGVSILISIVLLFALPMLFQGLYAFGNVIVTMGPLGAGLYAFFNRLLIPFGLHHALNNVFWFDTVGLGDLVHFWAGDVTGVNGVTWDLGMYMSGFFPCMMFGVPGAALAMYFSAKKEKRKAAASLLLSSSIASFLCGVTEPFEFSFMFAAFPLYVVYALLYGIFTVIVCLTGFRAGFSFSAGLTDLIFSASLPAAKKTWLIIPLGLAAFAVFFVIFYACIRRFDLKTPGREEEEAGAPARETGDSSFAETAEKVIAGLGGAKNIKSLDYCVTRIRAEVNDDALVDEKALRASGAKGVIKPGKNAVQIVFGPQVQFICDEMRKQM